MCTCGTWNQRGEVWLTAEDGRRWLRVACCRFPCEHTATKFERQRNNFSPCRVTRKMLSCSVWTQPECEWSSESGFTQCWPSWQMTAFQNQIFADCFHFTACQRKGTYALFAERCFLPPLNHPKKTKFFARRSQIGKDLMSEKNRYKKPLNSAPWELRKLNTLCRKIGETQDQHQCIFFLDVDLWPVTYHKWPITTCLRQSQP